jgi:LmbE family N-acetylglucosaminyl deacetylase
MNILFVGAHHDDLEVSVGGSVRRWVDDGHRVVSVIFTSSTWTGPDGTQFRDPATIERYAQNAAKTLGYTQISLNDSACFELHYTDSRVTTLLDIISEHAIDTLVTLSPNDAHPDHRAVSEIAINASRKTSRVLLSRVSWNSYPVKFAPNYFVDITGLLVTKSAALRCYEDEYARTGELWEKFIHSTAQLYGLEAGCDHAEGFEVLKYRY